MPLPLLYPEVAEALYQSLQVDAFYNTLEQSIKGDSETKHQGMLAYYDYSMREAEQHGILCLTADHSSGASIWSKPLAPDIQAQVDNDKKQFIETALGINSRQTYERIVVNMDGLTDDVIQGDEWYLSILGVHPAQQNKGLGKTLLSPVLKQTDKLGVDTFLETFTPRNMPFYERLGFKQARSFKELETNTDYAVMCRIASRVF